ncbi:unnamed protein product [Microthlaspi erraticum]|uniref:Uncharacterized protein n=1 Tax=Microthlaspi erraticum TaxID=1685480 RepID=A0A6D2IMX5_9BRAS|nr:unnamed protein product [Microthlaspi erraticum]
MFGDATSKSPLGSTSAIGNPIPKHSWRFNRLSQARIDSSQVNSLVSYRLQPRGSDFCATIESNALSFKPPEVTKVVKERVDKEPKVVRDKVENDQRVDKGPRTEKPRLEKPRVERPRSDRPRTDRLVQAPCVLDEESFQDLFDEPLGSAQKEEEDAASKALVGEKRKDPPA